MRSIVWFFKSKWFSLFPEVSNAAPLEIKILIFLHGLRKRKPLPGRSDVRCEFLGELASTLESLLGSLEYHEYVISRSSGSPLFFTAFSLTEKGRRELQRCGHL